MKPPIYSLLVKKKKSTGDNLDFPLASEVGVCVREGIPVGLSPNPMESDAISREIVSELI